MPKTNRALNYKVAMTGAFGALSVILSLTPLGYISLGGFIVITVMHIPVILAAILAGLAPGLGVGLVFGLTSCMRAVMAGGGANPFFLNPLVSVAPRLLIPVGAWLAYRLLGLVPRMPKVVAGGIAAAVGTLANTFFVMGAIYLFYGQALLAGMARGLEALGYDASVLSGWGGFAAILVCTMATNGVWEVAAAVALVVAVLGSVFMAQGRKSRLRRLDEDAEA